MDAYYEDDTVRLHLGDCRDVLPTLPDASVDAVVTDPPYELGFLGKAWDASGIAYNADVWRQCWRVLKPGGHLLAFGGTRTYHRMTVAIEDAGFEIRDSLHWIYGSGMPKGQNIGKAIDRRRDDRAQVLEVTAFLAAARNASGVSHQQIDQAFGFNGMASHWTAIAGKAATVPTPEQWDRLRDLLGFDDSEIRPLVAELNGRKGEIGEAWSQREVVGQGHRVRGESDVQLAPVSAGAYDLTAPATDAARQWHGWNTQLRPAHEPIVLARKSTGFNTTVANVLEHGTGALNVEGCRTASSGGEMNARRNKGAGMGYMGGDAERGAWNGEQGRWPANILLGHGPDCVDGGGCQPGCPVAEMDVQSGIRKAGERPAQRAGIGYMGAGQGTEGDRVVLDSGGASRFFPVFRYEAKAPASERPRLADGTAHTTVKPLSLMCWLIRLVTPPGGLVLDPFVGSGTTLEAAAIEGFHAVGVERERPYADLCVARLSKPMAPTLFA